MDESRRPRLVSKTDVAMLRVLQRGGGPMRVKDIAAAINQTEDVVYSRMMRLYLLCMAHRQYVVTSVGRSTLWTAVPKDKVPDWVPKSTASVQRANDRAKAKRDEKKRAVAQAIADWAPTQIRTTGSIPANLPPPTLAGIFSQLNRSNT